MYDDADELAECRCPNVGGKTSRKCICKPQPERDTRAEEAPAKKAADDGWAECSRRLQERNGDSVKAWKEEIDTLLVFVSLLAATRATRGTQV